MLRLGFLREARNCALNYLLPVGLTMLCLVVSPATAQVPGVTDTQIKVGSCVVLDGPNRQYGIQIILGATAYFDYVNDQGGVNGRKLTLTSFDDGYDTEKTGACFASLKREGVFTAGFFFGSATTAKYIPLLEAEHIPLLGTYSGAPFVYEPVKRGVFNVRASYDDETRELVENLWKSGVRRIGIIYQDDAFGKSVLDSAKQAMARHNAALAGIGSYTRNNLEVGPAIASVHGANPEAVIIGGTYAAAAEIVKRSHAQGWRPRFTSGSYIGTDAFITAAGSDAEGILSTQIVPSYDLVGLPTVKLYRECLAKYMSATPPGFVSLEAFVNAMVMVEGLRRAGKDLTREKFIAALESMNGFDVGLGPGSHLGFSSRRHKGLDQVYPTVVHGGKPQMFNDWEAALASK